MNQHQKHFDDVRTFQHSMRRLCICVYSQTCLTEHRSAQSDLSNRAQKDGFTRKRSCRWISTWRWRRLPDLPAERCSQRTCGRSLRSDLNWRGHTIHTRQTHNTHVKLPTRVSQGLQHHFCSDQGWKKNSSFTTAEKHKLKFRRLLKVRMNMTAQWWLLTERLFTPDINTSGDLNIWGSCGRTQTHWGSASVSKVLKSYLPTLISCWRHFINSVKLCLWLILHYLSWTSSKKKKPSSVISRFSFIIL